MADGTELAKVMAEMYRPAPKPESLRDAVNAAIVDLDQAAKKCPVDDPAEKQARILRRALLDVRDALRHALAG